MWANKYNVKQVHIGRLDYNGDLLEQINTYCYENNIRAGFVSVLGALQKGVVGFYNQQE
ncbi:MAG: DUF296 domain-containing protein, partial [Vampirovibrionia bacterium]